MAKYSYAGCVCVCVRAHEQVCSSAGARPLPLCVCASLCVGSGSICVWVRGEVSLGWPWLENWRRAEVKEEICRKDTHQFPHYYFFFFVYYVSASPCSFFFFVVVLSHSPPPPPLLFSFPTPQCTFLARLFFWGGLSPPPSSPRDKSEAEATFFIETALRI